MKKFVKYRPWFQKSVIIGITKKHEHWGI